MLFFGAMTRGYFFFVKLKLVAESVSESLGNSQGVTEVSLFLLNLLESKSA